MIFQEKCFAFYVLIMTKFHRLIALLLEILGNASIAIACFSGCDVINFEINLVFLIKPFFYMTKKSRQNSNILRTKRDFKVQRKAFLIIFKGFLVSKFCLRPESSPVIVSFIIFFMIRLLCLREFLNLNFLKTSMLINFHCLCVNISEN